MSGLGICCELPEVIRNASEGLDKPGAVVARQHAFACLEAKPLGHNACVPPVGRLEDGDSTAAAPLGCLECYGYIGGIIRRRVACSRDRRVRCYIPAMVTGISDQLRCAGSPSLGLRGNYCRRVRELCEGERPAFMPLLGLRLQICILF